MLKHNVSDIMLTLANENWRGFNVEELQELEGSIKAFIDAGYDTMGENYANIFPELSEESKDGIKKFTDKVKSIFPDQSKVQILDVGAGHGIRSVVLAEQEKINLKAIELSEYFYARHLLELEKEGKLPFGCAMKGDMCNLPFENGSFDALYCNAVLHHQLYLPGKDIGIEKAFSEFSRVLVKDGYFYLLTLYGDSPHLLHKRFFQSLNEESMKTLAKRNMFRIDKMEQIEGKGPFGDKTRWLEVCLQKR